MKLSEVKFEDLKIGDRVISHQGHRGEINKLVHVGQTARKEDNEIGILWDTGKTSMAWHFWMNFVTMDESEAKSE